jgi:hypothetical protein
MMSLTAQKVRKATSNRPLKLSALLCVLGVSAVEKGATDFYRGDAENAEVAQRVQIGD